MQRKATNKNYPRTVKALLEHSTIQAAADSIGLNRATIYRYLEDPDFIALLRTAEGQSIDTTTRGLVRLAGKALAALGSVLADPEQPGATNKRLAASAILGHLLKIRELRNIEERLTALEAVVNAK